FAPLVAVGGDVAENLSVWFALALHWMGTDVLACVVLWFGALGSLAKLGGLVACLPLAAVRGWIAVKGRPRAVAALAAGAASDSRDTHGQG
ncbi:MAG: hypothetical protein H0T52_02150, partial [Lautropia sp.]|nr:hypothetical protein [Lautropia sp.]